MDWGLARSPALGEAAAAQKSRKRKRITKFRNMTPSTKGLQLARARPLHDRDGNLVLLKYATLTLKQYSRIMDVKASTDPYA
jgi:hypothetical protein